MAGHDRVVSAVREAYDLDVVVLRMLDSERPRPHGGRRDVPGGGRERRSARSPRAAEALLPFDVELDDQPLRLPWANPGGPDADLRWAEEVLLARRIERVGPAEQIRSWNLSSIWRLPLAGGASAWLKVVPPFFAHEGAMLAPAAGRRRPAAARPRRAAVLLADIPGEDQYDADEPELLRDGRRCSSRSRRPGSAGWTTCSRIGAARLARSGSHCPHRRRSSQRRSAELPPDDGRGPEPLRRRPAGTLRRDRDCGLPDTLVHGDFHPGNVRGHAPAASRSSTGATAASATRCSTCRRSSRARAAGSRERVRAHWLDAWARPSRAATPDRAAGLLAPVAAARQAVIYQTFVDNIEPVERRHHDADVLEWLSRTAAIARDG